LLLLRGARAVPLVGEEAVLLQTRFSRSTKLVVAEADALTTWGRPVFVQEVQLLSAGKNSSQEAVLLQTRFARGTKLVVADAGNLTAWGGPVPVQEVQLLSTGKNSSQENRSVETPGLQHSSPASLNKHMLEAQSDSPRSVRPASSWMFVLLLVAVVIFVVVRLTIRGSGGAQSGTNQKESAEREAEGVNEKVKADATEKAKTGTSEKESESERAAEREESKKAEEGEIKLSEEMRRRLREIFDACDVDGNGTINKRELINTLRSGASRA
jgi:flagellar biosynthesis GTPase FlhF